MNSIAFALRAPMRAVASVTILALLAWAFGLPAWIHHASAANVADFTSTLSDSDLGAYATSTIQWSTANGMTDGQAFTISFVDVDSNGSNFNLTNVEQDDIVNPVGITILAGPCGGTVAGQIGFTVVNTTTIRGEACGTVASSTTIGFDIGRNSSADQATNPSIAGSYVVRLAGTSTTPIADTGDTRVYIIDDVTVTATVETIFEFAIVGTASGLSVNGDVDVTTDATTATSVPFGVIGVGDTGYQMAAQELQVSTNALNGFVVTVEADQTLTAGNGATIDEFVDGTAARAPWDSPNGTLNATDEYGHWGLASDDPTPYSGFDVFDSGNYSGQFIGNPVEVFWHTQAISSSSATTQGTGTTSVAYKVEIMELQEAANDYTATLTYVATPIF